MLNRFNSNTKKLNRIIPKINSNNLVSNDITGSLQNIEIPSNKKFNSKTKINSNPTKLVNNKTTIIDFHQEIFEHSARYITRTIDEINIAANSLIIKNVVTDYGTEGASPNNFEILVFGLHIPGDYIIKDVDNDVVITLGDDYIDFDNTDINDIYVIGKLVDIELDTENDIDILTENDENIII
jgi:hypothetical protein